MKVRYDTSSELGEPMIRKEIEVPEMLRDKHPVEIVQWIEEETNDMVFFMEVLN